MIKATAKIAISQHTRTSDTHASDTHVELGWNSTRERLDHLPTLVDNEGRHRLDLLLLSDFLSPTKINTIGTDHTSAGRDVPPAPRRRP